MSEIYSLDIGNKLCQGKSGPVLLSISYDDKTELVYVRLLKAGDSMYIKFNENDETYVAEFDGKFGFTDEQWDQIVIWARNMYKEHNISFPLDSLTQRSLENQNDIEVTHDGVSVAIVFKDKYSSYIEFNMDGLSKTFKQELKNMLDV